MLRATYDLERRRRAVSPRHRDRRHLPRQAASVRRRQGHLRPRNGLGQPVGQGPACRTRRRAGCAPSSPRCASMSRPRPRRESAFTTCSETATGCAIRSSAPRACASRRASSRPDASRSATGSSAPACAGPSPGPTPSSPCAAASSVGGLALSPRKWRRTGLDRGETPAKWADNRLCRRATPSLRSHPMKQGTLRIIFQLPELQVAQPLKTLGQRDSLLEHREVPSHPRCGSQGLPEARIAAEKAAKWSEGRSEPASIVCPAHFARRLRRN